MSNKLYTKHAAAYGKAITGNLYNALYERPSLLALLPSIEGLDVLDMGCGPGAYTEILVNRGANVTAIDLSDEMIELVKSRLGNEVRAYAQDLSQGLPREAKDSFDLVISPLTIHYIEDLKALFKEVARTLKPGGLFIFSTHHPMVDFQSSVSGNYLDTELLTEQWDTIGEPVEVQFYRRPLNQLFAAIETSGMSVTSLSEGKPDEKMKELSAETYLKLSNQAAFLFIKCRLG